MSYCSKGRSHGTVVMGTLCAKCCERLHRGQIRYQGKWRTLTECGEWIAKQRCMRGVVWAVEGLYLVGRQGTFTVTLKRDSLEGQS